MVIVSFSKRVNVLAINSTKSLTKKVTDPDRDLGTEYEKEKGKEGAGDYETDASGSNDPMSPEKIASHEPTAVKRDKNRGTSEDPV
jgi:hypothetical protein